MNDESSELKEKRFVVIRFQVAVEESLQRSQEITEKRVEICLAEALSISL